jgi:hypothetical protein
VKPEHITTDESLREDLIASLKDATLQRILAHVMGLRFYRRVPRETVTDTLNVIEIEIAKLRKCERGEE